MASLEAMQRYSCISSTRSLATHGINEYARSKRRSPHFRHKARRSVSGGAYGRAAGVVVSPLGFVCVDRMTGLAW